MKKIILLLLFTGLVLSCNCDKKEKAPINEGVEKAYISKMLDDWHLNASQTNFDAYFKAMTAEGVFVGTDAAEVWSKDEFKAFSKPYFDKGSAWSFTAVDRNIYFSPSGELAWFDELLDTWMGVCRGSGVLKKVDNSWLIEHYVLSLTVPNDNIGDVIEINKKKDSVFLKNIKK